MSDLCSASLILSPGIRIWLQDNCELVEFNRPEDARKQSLSRQRPGKILAQLEALATAIKKDVLPRFGGKYMLSRQSVRKNENKQSQRKSGVR